MSISYSVSFSFLLPYRIESELLRWHLRTLKTGSQPISSSLSSPNMNLHQIVLLPAKGEEGGIDNWNLAWVPSKTGDWDEDLSADSLFGSWPQTSEVQEKVKQGKRKSQFKEYVIMLVTTGAIGPQSCQGRLRSTQNSSWNWVLYSQQEVFLHWLPSPTIWWLPQKALTLPSFWSSHVWMPTIPCGRKMKGMYVACPWGEMLSGQSELKTHTEVFFQF